MHEFTHCIHTAQNKHSSSLRRGIRLGAALPSCTRGRAQLCCFHSPKDTSVVIQQSTYLDTNMFSDGDPHGKTKSKSQLGLHVQSHNTWITLGRTSAGDIANSSLCPSQHHLFHLSFQYVIVFCVSEFLYY